MEITSEKILDKMGELIQKAKIAPTEQRNGYLIAVQSLIDLVITDHTEVGRQAAVNQAISYTPLQQTNPTVSLPQEKAVKMEDANGDSLLDF